MVFVDVRPPSLGVTDEGGFGEFFQHGVESVKTEIVGAVLEVQQDGHAVVGGEGVKGLTFFGVAFQMKFLLANDDGSELEVFFDFLPSVGHVGHFIAAEGKGLGIGLRQGQGLLIAAYFDATEAVVFAVASGGAVHHAASGEKNGASDAHGALMKEQLLIGPTTVVGVLMDVDDGFDRVGLQIQNGAGEGKGGSEYKLAAGLMDGEIHGEEINVAGDWRLTVAGWFPENALEKAGHGAILSLAGWMNLSHSLRHLLSRGAAALLMTALGASSGLRAEGEVKPVAVDADLRLISITGSEVRPFACEVPSGKAAVVIFLTTDCPVANRYAPEIERIRADFAEEGVKMTLVHVDPDLTEKTARRHAAEFSLTAPVVIDRKHRLVAATGAKVTPEAVVIDGVGRIRYRGRINDQFTDFGSQRKRASQHDLRDAISAVLEGRAVVQPETTPVGCFMPVLKTK